jgi:CRP-like cAMP-binding protein
VPITAETAIERDSLFRGLPTATIKRVATLAVRHVHEAGAVIFMRGDPGDSLCGIVTGRVRISTSRAAGKEVFLNLLGPGETFGEIALLDGKPRTATATATTRTELTVIRRDPFLSLLRAEPQLAAHLIQLLCQRVRWTAELTEDSALLSVPARLAKRLVSLARLQGQNTPGGIRVRLSCAVSRLVTADRQPTPAGLEGEGLDPGRPRKRDPLQRAGAGEPRPLAADPLTELPLSPICASF